MSQIRHIRTKILKMTQAEFAHLARTRQATVSHWETGRSSPRQEDMQVIIEGSNGAVTAEDFFALSTAESEHAA